MRRGFVLTMLTLALFLILVQMTVALRTERMKVSSWTQAMMVDRKLLYATDDAAEEVRYSYGIDAERAGNQLTLCDSFPANYSIDRCLRGYRDFLSGKYMTADLSFQFYNASGSPIDLSALPPDVVVQPYNMTYHYEDYAKRAMSIYCAPGGACKGSNISAVSFAYKFSAANFTWVPTVGNVSHYHWSPEAMGGGCTGDPNCLNFSLSVVDSRGYNFSCPSAVCNYSQFPSSRQSVLDIAMAPCWFQITLGNNNIIETKLHQPNYPDQPCGTGVNACTNFNFSTQNFDLELPGSIGVTDQNFGFSRTYPLPGENVSARELMLEIPLPNLNKESLCFSSNPSGVYAGGSGNKYVYGFRMVNTCPSQRITITNMTVSWVPNSSEKIEVIQINSTTVWSYNSVGTPTGRQVSGTKLDILDWTMDPGITTNITYFRFQQGMLHKNFTINFTFGDNSTAFALAYT